MLSLQVTVKHGDQEGVQAFVDGFSGEFLVDRDDQIAEAVAVLQPAASGTCGPGGMCAALICGPPGTGKSHCGDDALFKLSKLQAQRLCMEKVTCRSAAAVKS
jgi:Cdc6-like AAA superfamily ATPase